MHSTGSVAAPLKVALIGCGKMGINHIKAIKACQDVRLVAIADPVADRSSVASVLPEGVEWFTSAQDMLERARPDVVHVVTPPSTHADVATLCLESGAHVYVEKPFTLTSDDAARVLEVAARAGRTVCAGHQLLFEAPARALSTSLPLIDRVVHVESYFAFRTVRKSRDGRSPLSPVEQLLDILPHPVYTLLSVLRASNPDADPEIIALDVRAEGDVRAVLRAGDATAVLIVTLNGRPIDSYLRVVGTNGSLRADFVKGALIQLPGPGTSAVSILTNPFREAKQVFTGSIRGFAHRIRDKKKGYPGLAELFGAFYQSVRTGAAPPLTPVSILETVRVCERVGRELRTAEVERERRAEERLLTQELALPAADRTRGSVLVTGGSGLLGTALVTTLRAGGWGVRSVSRRVPPPSARQAGIEYVAADLGQGVPADLLAGVSTIVHCAAETAGGKDAHERNTIAATRNLLEAAAAAGVKRFVHVSSIAVLKPGKVAGGPVDEQTPVDLDNLSRGPYVWGKAAAEHEVLTAGPGLGVDVRVVRPGPLVDFSAFEAPGRLGRDLGPVFVAIGPKRGHLSLCDVSTAALVLRSAVEDFDGMPKVLNLVEPEAPTRQQLLERVLAKRPELRAVWLPAWVLATLSPIAKLAQRILMPRSTPIDLAAAFSAERYNAGLAAEVIDRARRADILRSRNARNAPQNETDGDRLRRSQAFGFEASDAPDCTVARLGAR